jgi:beta-glucuronidase
MLNHFFFFLLLLLPVGAFAQTTIQNPANRQHFLLNGEWKYIVDPYQNGYYSYRMQPLENGYFADAEPQNSMDLIEYSFKKSDALDVPGDWNSQNDKLFFYEGTLWYRTLFEQIPEEGKRYFLRFGAVNYHARIYLDGKKLGEHIGGFTPFHFEITDQLEAGKNHSLVVMVDNKRGLSEVPTVNMDWWNYGGITRDVMILETPETFISDYHIQLTDDNRNEISARIDLSNEGPDHVLLKIEELGIEETIDIKGKVGSAAISVSELSHWSPENPKLYDVTLSAGEDTIIDQIGFRTIETQGDEILLNGKPVFLRGISIHEEAPFGGGRAHNPEQVKTLLNWAKELGCNFVRLAHYPHNEHMVRMAEKMGFMMWTEVPVYWTIDWENEYTYNLAEQQLGEMINRDKNRAGIILWSVANETPRSPERMKFLAGLISHARALDSQRLITAATELSYPEENVVMLDDPLIEYLDVIGANEYIGWYGGNIHNTDKITWKTTSNKPLVISEFGAGALQGHHGTEKARWTEEYQSLVYRNQVEMLREIPFFKGMSPWILVDFRSPRRSHPVLQDFWNRKGLISENGQKKDAFFELQKFYRSLGKN